jgi:hypothetical protein
MSLHSLEGEGLNENDDEEECIKSGDGVDTKGKRQEAIMPQFQTLYRHSYRGTEPAYLKVQTSWRAKNI